MIILNFTHPLTEKQQEAVAQIAGEPIKRVIPLERRFVHDRNLEQQIIELIDEIGLPAAEWQRVRIVVSPPAWAPAAVTLLAELHGRMGYFPELIYVRPAGGPGEPYEMAEIIDLRAVRSAAAIRRVEG